jgi:hypothetical protein
MGFERDVSTCVEGMGRWVEGGLCTEAEFLNVNWEKSLKSVLPWHSQSPLLTDYSLILP